MQKEEKKLSRTLFIALFICVKPSSYHGVFGFDSKMRADTTSRKRYSRVPCDMFVFDPFNLIICVNAAIVVLKSLFGSTL